MCPRHFYRFLLFTTQLDMTKLHLLFAIALFTSTLAAQTTKKYILVEHITNSKCGVCANRNPALYTLIQQPNNADDVHHVTIHPSIPYNSCRLYQANTAENEAWRNVYGVNSTPRVALNGTLLPSSSGALLTQAQLDGLNTQTSPFNVRVEETVNGTNRTAKVTLGSVGTIPQGNYRVYVALLEKNVKLNNPIEVTGENHYNVFRDMLTAVTGDAFTPASKGGGVVLNYTFTANAAWNANELYVLAFIKNVDTKAVENSGTRFDPTVTLGADDVAPLSVQIMPNPASDLAYAQIEDDVVETTEIFALDGSRVFLSAQPSQGTVELPLSTLKSGVYVVKMTGAKGVYVGKLVKE
jgi:hypothetical protein